MPHLRDEDLFEPTAFAEAHLVSCTLCAGRRDAQLAVRLALRELSREGEVPTRARELLARRRAELRRRGQVPAGVALGMAAVLMAILVARRPSPMPVALADELALDHLHYQHHAEAAEVRGDAVTIASYFQSRLGFTPHFGPLEAATFEGAKPCRIAGKWTALAWIDRAGHWVSVFTMPEHEVSEAGCMTLEGVRVCGAPDPHGGARVLVGDLSEAEMLRLVNESLL